MTPIKPQQKVLSLWRALAVALAVPPAFLCSFMLRAPSPIWLAGTGGWVAVFLFFYLFYLPRRYLGLSFRIHGGALELFSGVFVRRHCLLPIANIQFTTVVANPCSRIFGLCSLRVVSPGARMLIPGLTRRSAEELALLLTDGEAQ